MDGRDQVTDRKSRKSTCAGCRRRKSKCDGRMPRCTTCIAYKDECHYDKPPSLAYVRSLEEEIAELKSQLRQARTQAWLTKVRLCVDDWSNLADLLRPCRTKRRSRYLPPRQAMNFPDSPTNLLRPPAGTPSTSNGRLISVLTIAVV